MVLKPMWELLDEIMDEVSAEPQGDKCSGDKEEPSADAPCKNSSAGHREGHRRLFPLSQETATSIFAFSLSCGTTLFQQKKSLEFGV